MGGIDSAQRKPTPSERLKGFAITRSVVLRASDESRNHHLLEFYRYHQMARVDLFGHMDNNQTNRKPIH